MTGLVDVVLGSYLSSLKKLRKKDYEITSEWEAEAASKLISNFYRSPQMSDAVEFAVDVSTSMDDIGAIKGRIKAFLESKLQYWRPEHSVLVKGTEDMNKMHMGLYVNHTMNFENGERGNRISVLVLEMKKIFEEIGIGYHLPTQEVHVRL